MKRIWYLLVMVGLTVMLAACSQTAGNQDSGSIGEQENSPTENQTSASKETTVTKNFGTYTVPAGWVEVEYANKNETFYVKQGHEHEQTPDNISVGVGTNRYAADDHVSFRDAIRMQLAEQIANQADTQLAGEGTDTEQGNILYIFTIEGPEATTKQYNIVGEKKFCLIHLTNFSGDQEAEEVARQIAESFVWSTD